MKIQGFKFYQAGRLAEAQQAFQQACAQNPADAESWMMLGVISAQLGALPQALAQLQRATQLQPNFGPAWSNLGLAQLTANQLPEAEASLRRATDIDPKDANSYNNLGALYQQQGQVDAAIAAYQAAIARQPRDANAHNNLGGILQEQCRTDEAISAYQRALKIAPRFAQAEFNLGSALQGTGQHEQALYHFRKALQLEPGLEDANAAIARLQEKEGRYEAALNTLAPLLKGAATSAATALTYADVARRTGASAHAIELLNTVNQRRDLSNVERQKIEFALGDLLDQQGDYANAFAHYHRANTLRPYPYDDAAQAAQLQRLMERFPVGSLPSTDLRTDQYPAAIFIVGMPRSSTSLVEQILASHPDVHGGGELPYVGSLLAQFSREHNIPAATLFEQMQAQDIRNFGQRYLKQLRSLNPTARYITDKMPHNFMQLGLIAQAIPGVRIIHTQRSALDTCLSIYFHNFNANHPYASDLKALGQYYRHYERLMGHWRGVLGTQMLDIAYDALLADQEAMTRRLLDHCGLSWHAGCLDFHETQRIVNTPSYDQVRRPMYRSSLERWRHYEKHLAPLIDALEATGSLGR